MFLTVSFLSTDYASLQVGLADVLAAAGFDSDRASLAAMTLAFVGVESAKELVSINVRINNAYGVTDADLQHRAGLRVDEVCKLKHSNHAAKSLVLMYLNTLVYQTTVVLVVVKIIFFPLPAHYLSNLFLWSSASISITLIYQRFVCCAVLWTN